MTQANQEINNILLERLGYLIHELQALQTLTDVLPFDQEPPEGTSVLGHLNSIFQAENKWVSPLIDKILLDSSGQSLSMESIPTMEGVNDLSASGNSDPLEVTQIFARLIESRSKVLNHCKVLSNDDFNRKIWIETIEEQLTISDFIHLFLDVETLILKSIGRFVSDLQTENIMMRSAGIRS